jgi:hypothetical protein
MGTIINVTYKEVDDEIIQADRLFNVYLLGLPRSGTSVTTKVLELLGVNMVYTSEDKIEKRDERIKKRFGKYHPNETGFFEVTTDQLASYLKLLSTPYSGCKMIVPVLGVRWELIKMKPAKIILMVRDLEEVRQSQVAFFREDGSAELGKLRTMLTTQRMRLQKSGIDFMEVDYNELIMDRVSVIQQIKEFIRSDVNIDEAVAFVQPSKNRFKIAELTHGI